MLSSTMAPEAVRQPGSGLFCLVMSGFLWGTGGLTGGLLSRAAGLSSIAVAAYRLTVGGALIVAFLVLTGRRWPAGRAAWARITGIGLLAALFQGCYFTAVALTSVSLATLITIGSAPVIVLAADRVISGRKVGWRAGGTAGVALTGLGLLVGLPSGGFSETAVLVSATLAVLAAAGFASVTLLAARPVPGLDDLTVTGFGFLLGGLLLPLAASTGGLGFRPGLATVGLLIALGALLEPLTGVVLAALILGDRLSGAGIAGAVILAVAVILTIRGRPRTIQTRPAAMAGSATPRRRTAPKRTAGSC